MTGDKLKKRAIKKLDVRHPCVMKVRYTRYLLEVK